MYMNNLQSLDDRYDNLQNCTVNILEHSIYKDGSANSFNITGTMVEKPKSELDKKNITLIINTDSEGETTTNSSCTVYKITDNNYTLNCESSEKSEIDLQSAISFINNEEILLVNFDNGNNTNANTESTKSNPTNRRYVSKSSGGLNAGGIVAIILAHALVVAAVVGMIFYMKNANVPNEIRAESVKESVIEKIK